MFPKNDIVNSRCFKYICTQKVLQSSEKIQGFENK
jgi:hypothetical protein